MSKTQRQNEVDRKNILELTWDEVKKINWQEINSQTSKSFSIGLVGNDSEINSMEKWLCTFKYKLASENEATIKKDSKKLEKSISEYVIPFSTSNSITEKSLRNVSFCLVSEGNTDLVNKAGAQYFLFAQNNDGLSKKIIDNHEDISFALSYNFPAFRTVFSNKSIQNTSIQNASWAIATASPNLVPGPHQVVTVPIEAISDFTVLTANQTKMLFELLGLSGQKINPAYCLIEFGVVLGLANVAKAVATNTVGKVPAGAGLVIKGSVAYAFTTVIGESLFYYITTGKKVSKSFIQKRFNSAYDKAKDIVEDLIKRKNNKAKLK